MKLGYIRISVTEQQDNGNALSSQEEKLKKAGADEILIDVASRAWDGRTGFLKLQELVREEIAKEVIVTRMSRLSDRDTLIKFEQLCQEKGCKLTSLDEAVVRLTASRLLHDSLSEVLDSSYINDQPSPG